LISKSAKCKEISTPITTTFNQRDRKFALSEIAIALPNLKAMTEQEVTDIIFAAIDPRVEQRHTDRICDLEKQVKTLNHVLEKLINMLRRTYPDLERNYDGDITGVNPDIDRSALYELEKLIQTSGADEEEDSEDCHECAGCGHHEESIHMPCSNCLGSGKQPH
jgi:hypothetical protein